MTGNPQRRIGTSFRVHYADAACASTYATEEFILPAPFRRSPSLTDAGDFLVPLKPPHLQGRLTVVLDLDETLVYAREGPLYVRPGMEELMTFLSAHCETIVWTSSVHRYADAVLAQIDHCGAVQHTIYRHKRWFKGKSAAKDLRLLGRDLDSTIIIENTPDCLVGYEHNGVLVEDYEGGELEDHTLHAVLVLLEDLVAQHATGVSVPEYIRTTGRLLLRELPTDRGTPMPCYCLASNEEAAFPTLHRTQVSRPPTVTKLVSRSINHSSSSTLNSQVHTPCALQFSAVRRYEPHVGLTTK